MIVAGFGFRSGAGAASLHDALIRAAGSRPVHRLATAADKAGTPAFRALAAGLVLPVTSIPPAALEEAATVTCSPASLAARRTGSVAEAAALAAAGPGARLLGPRAVSADRKATCALAEAP